jgi:hypothetical protein
VTRFAGWAWDQIPTHWQVKVPGRVFRWFEHQAWRRDEIERTRR